MGTVAQIGFQAGDSVLHKLDPRSKQLLILALSLASLGGSVTFLSATSITIFICFRLIAFRFSKLLYAIRFFMVFLLAILVIRIVTLDANWLPTIRSYNEIGDALIICWRLLLVVLMCLLLMVTTRTTGIRAALIWMLKPIPLVNEKATATMVGLLLRFLPLILLQAGETGDAMRARGIERTKNPIKRLIKFTIPLFRRVFLRADELVDTMQARCYNDNRTVPELVFTKLDTLAAATALFLIATTFFP